MSSVSILAAPSANIPGDYTAYLEANEREEAERKVSNSLPARGRVDAISANGNRGPKHPPTAEKPKSKKLTFKEQRKFEGIEQRIADTEKRLPEIEEELNAAAADAGRVHELFIEQQTLKARLEIDLSRWAELADRVDE